MKQDSIKHTLRIFSDARSDSISGRLRQARCAEKSRLHDLWRQQKVHLSEVQV